MPFTVSHSAFLLLLSAPLLYYCYYCIYNDIKLYILFLYYCFTMNSLILLIHVSVAYWNKYHQIKPSTLIIPTFAVNTIYEILRQAEYQSQSQSLYRQLLCVFFFGINLPSSHTSHFYFFPSIPSFFFFSNCLCKTRWTCSICMQIRCSY